VGIMEGVVDACETRFTRHMPLRGVGSVHDVLMFELILATRVGFWPDLLCVGRTTISKIL